MYVKMKRLCLLLTGICLTASMSAPVRADMFPPQGIYEICSAADQGFVLDAKHCTQQAEEFSELQMYRPLQVKQQEFYLEFISAHSCRIVNLESGLYLSEADVSQAAGGAPGENTGSVRLEEKSEAAGSSRKDHQFWNLVSRPDGSYLLCSASGLYLSLDGKRPFNGTGLSLLPFTGGDEQKWMITPVPVYAAGEADTDVVNPYLEDGPLQDVQVSIRFNEAVETLEASDLASWMSSPDDHTLTFDEEKLCSYVSGLAEKYNTVGKPRRFVTSYQVPITLSKGNFGWKLDEDGTVRMLREAISKAGRRTIVPGWSQKGWDYNGTNTDIGDSYVEVDLNAQKVWLYQNGRKILETDCVSGTLGTGRETPGGVYFVYYKQSPAVLTGPDYSSPVTFWMPFNGGIGLHDASWRSSFGGDIYRTNGSHGCINLPYSAAEMIYKTVTIGYPVVCYH